MHFKKRVVTYVSEQNVRMFVMVYQLVASVIYSMGEYSLVPPYRLAQLTSLTALDYFPNGIGYAISASIVLFTSFTWQYYAWRTYKLANAPDIIFKISFKKPGHAFHLATGMIFAFITEQMLPYVDVTVNVWTGFALQLVALFFLLMACIGSILEFRRDDLEGMSIKFRMMVKILASYVTFWQVMMFFFWFLKGLDPHLPENEFDKENMALPSPSPTALHQKMISQMVGVGFMILGTLICVFMEFYFRAYGGIFATMVFLAFVTMDDNISFGVSFWTAISCLIICLIILVIEVPISELVLIKRLREDYHERKEEEELEKK